MRGLQVYVEVQVSQPVETVWRYVVEGYCEHHSRWDPAVVEMVKLTSGPVEAGTRGRECVGSRAGRRPASRSPTRPDRPGSLCPTQAGRSLSIAPYEFKPNGAGCTVSFSFDIRPRAAMRLAFSATPQHHRRTGQGQHRPPSLRPGRSRRDTSLAVKQ